MTEGQKPYVAAAFLCERILTEKDDVLTYVRVVDTLIGRYRAADVPAGKEPQVTFQVWLAVSLRSGEAKGKFKLRLRMVNPAGNKTDLGDEIPIPLLGGEHGANVNTLLALSLPSGLFDIEVLVGEDLLTKVPFRVRLEAVPTPEELGKHSTPSRPAAADPER